MARSAVAAQSSFTAHRGGGAQPDAARVLLVLALTLTFLSYIGTLRYAFVYDDLPQIINNPRVHSLARAPKLFTEHVWSQFSGQPGNYYRPVFELWLVLNYTLFGLRPFWWHLTTIAMHLVVTGLVYVVLKRVSGDRLLAAMATVIFGLHPTHIETTAWVSGIPEPLMAAAFVGSFYCYLRWQEDAGPRPWWAAGSLALYAVAMLAKETAIVLPAVLLAYDWIVGAPAERRLGALLRRYTPYALVGLCYLAARQAVLHGMAHPEPYPPKNVLLTVPTFLWFYVRDLIWPVGLSVFHDTPLVQHPGLRNFVLPLIGAALFIGLLVWAGRRWRLAAFGGWWLLLLMLPPILGVYAFIPEDLVHDRYLYLPALGFALVVAVALRRIRSGRDLFGGPAVQMGLALALAAGLAAGTAAQTVYWANDLTLYAHAVTVAPQNVIAINHLANEFYKRKRPDVALELYQKSLAIKPTHWPTHLAMGITLYEIGRLNEAQQQLEQATRLLPLNNDQFYYLGLVHYQKGEYAQAEKNVRAALAMFPARPQANLLLGMILEKENRPTEAREAYRTELKYDPGSAAARGVLQRLEGQK